jgi:uncharacterized repeat protein (TIGR03806 family)
MEVNVHCRRTACLLRPAVRILLLALLFFCAARGVFAIDNRVANTTLQMPATPPSYGYTTTNAFGLSFQDPLAIVQQPGQTNRLYIVEQAGRVVVITNLIAPTRTVFLDISGLAQYRPGEEEGLLGMAFHPNYSANGYFYVFYTTRGTRYDRLSRFQVDPADPARALPGSELILINQFDEAPNHNGGDLHFGPDGYLYVSLGDEGGGGDTYLNSQRIDKDFFSGMLRIDVDKRPGNLTPNSHAANNINGAFNYSVPADNPFVGATSFNGRAVDPANVRTEFWAVGLRNPWRFSFDPVTGYLYCGDVGQSDREEVDIIIKGGNYGWSDSEGNYRPSPNAPFIPYVHPILDYDRTQGRSVTGGVVYRGSEYSDLYGCYIFADYLSANIWSVRYQVNGGTTNITGPIRIGGDEYIAAFGTHPADGSILLADQSEDCIKKLVRVPNSGQGLPGTLAETGAFANLATLSPNAGISPYELNVPFWSDNAKKTRWFSVPGTASTITFNPTSNWAFPAGTVWIKHFDLEMVKGDPSSAKRIETRFVVRTDSGIYGVTYRWGSSTSNATLVPDEGMDETFVINDGGNSRNQVWHYPSRSECVTCHTAAGGYALGFNTPQLNRSAPYNGGTANQITALRTAGYLDRDPGSTASLPALALAADSAVSLEHRARSYLTANCVNCHQPGGGAQGFWDARITTPLAQAGIVDGGLVDTMGDSNNRVIKPGSLANSVMYQRVSTLGSKHMPPLATSVLDSSSVSLLRDWILSLNPPQRPSPPRNLRISGN